MSDDTRAADVQAERRSARIGVSVVKLTRRSFAAGLVGFVACSPAIVRASSLMPVKVWRRQITLREYAVLAASELDDRYIRLVLSEANNVMRDLVWAVHGSADGINWRPVPIPPCSLAAHGVILAAL